MASKQRNSRNKAIGGGAIKTAPFDAENSLTPPVDESNIKAIKKAEKAAQFVGDIEEYTQSQLCHHNYMIHEFKNISPESKDWTIWKYYPNASGGPVFIDCPQGERQLKLCEKKAEVMKKMGRKYLIYQPDHEQALQEMGAN